MDSNSLYDIYDMWHVAWWQLPWVKTAVICGSGILLLGVMFFIGYFLTRRKKTLSLWQQALADLNTLGMRTFSNKREVSQGYLDLASLLKQYIITRYNLPAQGLTDEELVALFNDQVTDKELHEDLTYLLNLRTVISFASSEPTADAFDDSIRRAMRIVNSTIEQHKQL